MKMTNFCRALGPALLMVFLVVVTPVWARQTVDLESFTSTDAWRQGAGLKPPGGQIEGQIRKVAGKRQMTFRYDFTEGGANVYVRYVGRLPARASGYAFVVTPSEDTRVYLRLVDDQRVYWETEAIELEAERQATLAVDLDGPWRNQGAGPSAASVQQVVIRIARSGADRGRLAVERVAALLPAGESVVPLGPERPAAPFTDSASAVPGDAAMSYMLEKKLPGFHAMIGTGGFNTALYQDARDLRVFSRHDHWSRRDDTLVMGLWGRLFVTGPDTELYATPSDIRVQSWEQGGRTVWRWGHVDSRIGLQQYTQAYLNADGTITATVYFRFLKPHRGRLTVQYRQPGSEGVFYAGAGTQQQPYVQTLKLDRVTRATYPVGDELVSLLFAVAHPAGVQFGQSDLLWDMVFKGRTRHGHIIFEPTTGDVFPAGYTNAVQVHITREVDRPLPDSIEAPNWREPVNVSLLQRDEQGQWRLPAMYRPYLFSLDETPQVGVRIDNLIGTGSREVAITCTLRDYRNNIVHVDRKRLTLEPQASRDFVFDLPVEQPGIYSLTVRAEDSAGYVDEETFRISQAPRPRDIPAEASFFGAQPFSWKATDADLTLYKNLGLRWIRLGYGYWTDDDRLGYLKQLEKHDIGRLVSHEDFHEELAPYVKYWEIGNEPNLNVRDVGQYVSMLKAHAPVIRANDPDAVIAGSSVSGSDVEGRLGWTRRVFQQGGAAYLDLVPLHPYSPVRHFGPGREVTSLEEHGFLRHMAYAEQVLGEKYNQRIWMGEIGWDSLRVMRFPTASFSEIERDMANHAARLFLLAKLVPSVERVIWFNLFRDELGASPNAHQSHSGMNLLGTNDNITPRLMAVTNLAALIDGTPPARRLAMPLDDIYTALFEREHDRVLAMWVAGDDCLVRFEHDTPMTRIRIDGARSQVMPDAGHIELALSGEPFYLLLPRGDDALIERVEAAAVEYAEPVELVHMALPQDDRLALLIRNKLPHALAATVTIEAGSVRQSFEHRLGAAAEERLTLDLHEAVDRDAVESVIVSITAAGRTAVAERSLTEPVASPELVAVRADARPRIDGQLDDDVWGTATPIRFNGWSQVLPNDPGIWTGPDDLSATAYVLYDAEYLYLACRVQDQAHHNDNFAGKIWDGDSIQLGLSNTSYPYAYHEINLGLSSEEGPVSFLGFGRNSGSPIEGIELAIERDGHETRYEAAIPLETFEGVMIGPGTVLHFALIINDVDEVDRKWMGMDQNPAAIGGTKDIRTYPRLQLFP